MRHRAKRQSNERNHSAGAASESTGRLSKWQRRGVLVAFSIVFTLVVIGGLEGVLRLAGYGGYAPVFVKGGTLADGSSVVFTSREGAASYFFANRSRPGTLIPTSLVMPKPEGTVRIVLVGASAVRGSPYPRPLWSGAFLQAMLSDVWPQRDVEVINLGTTAVASYPVLGMMTEALKYEPDLVVAYVGNNEFYGAYGVASLHSAGRSPGMIRLIRRTRSLGIAQFIDAQFRSDNPPDSRTLMEAMVGQGSIGPDDPLRSAAATNLERFVGDMIDRCQARDIPIIVCTPPANERGLAPLGAADGSSVSESDRAGMDQAIAEAMNALPEDPVGAEDAARRAIGLDAEHATAQHLLGRALHAQADYEEAAKAFRLSVDLDPMPWRPPSSSVDAIRSAAGARGVPLCDLAQTFRDASEGGSVGWELMNDHVHPSLAGQALVARSIVELMSDMDGAIGVDRALADALPGWEAYADRLGFSDLVAYETAVSMRSLGSISFFHETNPAFFERFDAECTRIEAASPPHVVEQFKAWADPASHVGLWRPITGMAGRALYELGQFEEAERAFVVAAASVDPYSSWDLQYTFFTMLCRMELKGELDEADLRAVREGIERGRVLLSKGASNTGAGERFMGELLQLDGQYEESIPPLRIARAKFVGINRVAADQALVLAYLETGKISAAREIVDAGMRGDQRLIPHYESMGAMVNSVEGGP